MRKINYLQIRSQSPYFEDSFKAPLLSFFHLRLNPLMDFPSNFCQSYRLGKCRIIILRLLIDHFINFRSTKGSKFNYMLNVNDLVHLKSLTCEHIHDVFSQSMMRAAIRSNDRALCKKTLLAFLQSIQSLHRLLQPFLNIMNMSQIMTLFMLLWLRFIIVKFLNNI